MPRGVRTRAVLIATVVTAIATIAIALVATTIISRNLHAELDRSLRATLGSSLEQFFLREDDFAGDDAGLGFGLDPESDFSLIVSLDESGSIADGIAEGNIDTVGFGALAFGEEPVVAAAAPSDDALATVSTPTGRRWRIAAGVFADAEGLEWRMILGRDVATVDERVSAARRWLLGAALLSTLLMATAMWFGVGAALRPVERLRAQAASISAGSMSQRLAEPGSNDEVDRLARTLNDLLARIEHSQASQRRFVSDASHELRNPVASVAAQLEVGLRAANADDWPEIAGIALRDARRMERLVADLLTLARADEGVLPLRRQLVDVDDIVLQAIASARAASPSIAIDASHVSAAAVDGDVDRISQIVTNLIANAARHARSRVAVHVAQADGWAHVAVDDDGPGVPSDRREQIFQRFVRLDEARARDSGGSGLGLAISRLLATAHGGHLVAEDGPLGGARFRLVLPVSPDRLDRQASPPR